jgi:hypothetical protein
MNTSSKFLAASLMVAAAPWLTLPASALPISSPLVLQAAVTPLAETVQYRRGWRGGYRGRGFGGVGVGLGIAGAIIGGAIIASQPYGYRGYAPGYVYGPDYDERYVAASPSAGEDEVVYCQQRFRSYDPGSGTYLGFDGLRHPCP